MRTPTQSARTPPKPAAATPAAHAEAEALSILDHRHVAAARIPGRSRAVADAVLVVVASLLTYAVASALELAESFNAALLRHESWQADEVPFVLLVLALGLAWYALRRRGEARHAMAMHRQASVEVAQLLERNRQLTQQLIGVQESERAALARELHDELGQRCTAIRIEAAVIRGAAATPRNDMRTEVNAAAQRIANNAGALHDMVRNMLRRLRPAELDELGLVEALRSLCEGWQVRSSVTCTFQHAGQLDNLPDATNVAIYRIVQEALSNVMRHARARRVQLRLTRAADAGLVVQVSDDGVGMDAQATPRGLGLLGAAERAAALGGELRTQSWPGEGTTVIVRLPAAATQAGTPVPALGARHP